MNIVQIIKPKHEIKSLLGGHHMIKNENGFEGFKSFPNKRAVMKDPSFQINIYRINKAQ